MVSVGFPVSTCFWELWHQPLSEQLHNAQSVHAHWEWAGITAVSREPSTATLSASLPICPAGRRGYYKKKASTSSTTSVSVCCFNLNVLIVVMIPLLASSLRSPTFIYSDAATVCGGEGRGKHSAQLLCPGKSKTNDQLAEGGGGARNQHKILGKNDRE